MFWPSVVFCVSASSSGVTPRNAASDSRSSCRSSRPLASTVGLAGPSALSSSSRRAMASTTGVGEGPDHPVFMYTTFRVAGIWLLSAWTSMLSS